MKPKLFIGSSVESLGIAYAIQENLEFTTEVTVWSQGIFELSKFSLDSLLDAVEVSDFGIFVFSPDDISIIRGVEKRTIRDNVIFELGLFIGKLGKERSFIVLPRGCEEDVAFPTDLLGLTSALFEPDRQDQNMQAALGPACAKISKAVKKQGTLQPSKDTVAINNQTEVTALNLNYSEGDIKAMLASWMGSRPASENLKIIHYAEIDRELKVPEGSTRKYIKEIASSWKYVVNQAGDHTILFKKEPVQYTRNKSRSDSWKL